MNFAIGCWQNKKMILILSGVKGVNVMENFIFFIREVIIGIWREVRILEPKMIFAGCICIHQVRNKI